MFKVNNKDTRRHWRRSGLFIVNFEHTIAGWDTNGQKVSQRPSLC